MIFRLPFEKRDLPNGFEKGSNIACLSPWLSNQRMAGGED
jgi:hypothetical protein